MTAERFPHARGLAAPQTRTSFLSRARRAALAALALALLAGAVAPRLHAQGLMLRGGMNFSGAKIDPEPSGAADMRRGFNAALLAELGGGPVRLVTGAGYDQRGARMNDGTLALDYVTVPLMISMGPPSVSANAAIFLNIGVEPAFLLSSNIPAGNAALTEEDLSDFDVAARAELGVELPVSYSGPSVVLGGAYTIGLTDINDGAGKWRAHAFHLFAALKLRSL